MAETTHCPVLLAIELGPGAPAGATLPTEVATTLADHVAMDLARLAPGIEALDLALAAALMDPAQVLRPGWPVFAELGAQLARARRGAGSRVVAFGSAGGRMVSPPLEPDAALGLGALAVLPLVLAGDAAIAHRVGARLEDVLHEQGLAGAAVALLLQQALGLDVVHARYFTHHDLAALVAIQLDHANCAPAWAVLEAALFAAARDTLVASATGQAWRWRDGRVRGGALDVRAWRAGPGAAFDEDELAPAFAAWQAEQRRYSALFAAHGLGLDWLDATNDATLEGEPLAQAFLLRTREGDAGGTAQLHAHGAAGIGSYAFTATVDGRAIAACYPLAAGAVAVALAALRIATGASGDPLPTRALPAL